MASLAKNGTELARIEIRDGDEQVSLRSNGIVLHKWCTDGRWGGWKRVLAFKRRDAVGAAAYCRGLLLSGGVVINGAVPQ